ncbi:MAG: sulfatase-like hydrolase/transferase, partial [Bacteroidota bacterium]
VAVLGQDLGYGDTLVVQVALVFFQIGYQTFMSGKWHLGKDRENWPDKNGFDQFYGTPAGGGIYFYPSLFYKREVFWNGKRMEPDSTWYSTDAFTDYAINYIVNDREKDKPFFMYLPYIAPHFPLQAKKEDLVKYKETYTLGYDAIRDRRIEKQRELGLVTIHVKASQPTFPPWHLVPNKEEEALKMAVYAAMVDCMDQNIGRLLHVLEEEGLKDNTVIFFLSDNGAANTSFNKTPQAEIGTRYSNASYGAWHNVSNTPYQKYKATEHEGGIITPMIVYGLDHFQGKTVRNPAHITDFMPTCLELASVEYPQSYNSLSLDPLDGKSLLPLIDGTESHEKRYFFWEHQGNKAVRQGDWKLVALHNKEWELYHITSDPYELNDLSKERPGIVMEFKGKYDQWTKKHGVQPWPLKE